MPERLFLRLDDDPLHGPEADVPAGSLRAYAVPAALRAHVAHILFYRETVPQGHEMPERVLPDGAVRLVFNFGDVPCADGDGGAGQPAQAIGSSATPVVVRLRGRVDGISVTLRPGAAAALLGGVPAGDIAERVLPLEALWRSDGGDLLERMADAPQDAARIAVLQDALIHKLRGHDGPPSAAALHAARLITEASGRWLMWQPPSASANGACNNYSTRTSACRHAHGAAWRACMAACAHCALRIRRVRQQRPRRPSARRGPTSRCKAAITTSLTWSMSSALCAA